MIWNVESQRRTIMSGKLELVDLVEAGRIWREYLLRAPMKSWWVPSDCFHHTCFISQILKLIIINLQQGITSQTWNVPNQLGIVKAIFASKNAWSKWSPNLMLCQKNYYHYQTSVRTWSSTNWGYLEGKVNFNIKVILRLMDPRTCTHILHRYIS